MLTEENKIQIYKQFEEYLTARKGRLDAGPGSHTPQTAMGPAGELPILRRQAKEQEKEIRRLKEENEFPGEAGSFFAASRRKSAKGRE